ncbi:MAG: glycosyltransferase family 2 protein [Lachnospiraceae bacterium]|nr:glycosyltransferase family 2 protein [Lachnospiraceae bacterium]
MSNDESNPTIDKIAKLAIVIPCYNEEEVLPITAPMFLEKLNLLISSKKIANDSYILFVNDGSKDKTWEIISELADSDNHYKGIALSRNRGHQNALLAGLMEAKLDCDITISIDCDGQDDINAMDEMIKEYYSGADIVYGVRSNRSSDSFFKRASAQSYYRILNKMGVEVIYNHADYRLTSKRVLDELANFKEVNLYLRGMFALVGFKSTSVYYERRERKAGKSHYPIRKMLGLAIDGVTSFSIQPIRFITGLGVFMALFSFLLIIYALVSFVLGNVVHGWASSIISVLMIGGIQLISLGVIGEYVGKIYLETKDRPRYIISDKTDDKKDK